MLYPQNNPYRAVYNLNGIWDFSTVEENYSPEKSLAKKQLMPVPSSYNDIVADRELREHVGKVVYEREVSIPFDNSKEYYLRIGATSHKCEVFWNGKLIGKGPSGFLPIDIKVEDFKEKNRLSVLIDNRLTYQTLPPGKLEGDRQIFRFDFYNFTGIHRDVLLCALPKTHIEDITVQTVVDNDYHKVKISALPENVEKTYVVYDKEGKQVATSTTGDIYIENPHLWECKKSYLYTVRVQIEGDYYEEKFGIRKVSCDENGLYLNDKKVYLKGFGKHEDFWISGKGNNSAVNVRDFELLKWIGANSFRTSHYPYCEEIMRLADEYGIMVIDEVPAVGVKFDEVTFGPEVINEETKALHKELLSRLVDRDKNHPCVVMLSVANETAAYEPASREYFVDIVAHTRTLSKLPITIIEDTPFNVGSYLTDLVDIISLNRYYGWYDEHGRLDKIQTLLQEECDAWHNKYNKPILLSEFGADAVEGNHCFPSECYSEEYQAECLQECFDGLNKLSYVIGEHIWNFADFRTKQGLWRMRGNRKGIFTRERQPKAAAFVVKKRWEEKGDFI